TGLEHRVSRAGRSAVSAAARRQLTTCPREEAPPSDSRRSHLASVESPDFDGGGRCIVKDLVLDRHRREAPLESRSILRSRFSAGLDDADVPDFVVSAIIPV